MKMTIYFVFILVMSSPYVAMDTFAVTKAKMQGTTPVSGFTESETDDPTDQVITEGSTSLPSALKINEKSTESSAKFFTKIDATSVIPNLRTISFEISQNTSEKMFNSGTTSRTNAGNNSSPNKTMIEAFLHPSNINSSSVTSPPFWVSAMKGKLPPGFDNVFLNNIFSRMPLNMEGMTKLLTSLAPQLPSLLRGLLSNTSSTKLSTQCSEDTEFLLGNLLTGKLWALRMIDAAGKPGPSIVEGNVNFLGNFDECLEVESVMNRLTGRTVRADTCAVFIAPPAAMTTVVGAPKAAFGAPFVINWHVCVPNTCDGPTVNASFAQVLSHLGLAVVSTTCHSDIKHGPVGSDPVAVGAVCLVAILTTLVLLGSALDLSIRSREGCSESKQAKQDTKRLHELYNHVKTETQETSLTNGNVNGHVNDAFQNEDIENGKIPEGFGREYNLAKTKDKTKRPLWQRLLLCFSAVTNGEKILSVKRTPGSLTCLNGIRVLSMGWVILGHSFFFMIMIADNPAGGYKLINTFSFQIIVNGTLSVDSFFVLSGLLVSFLFLRETEKEGGLKVKHMIMYYVHRYLRLTPAYAFMLYLHTYLVLYLADGTMWTGILDRTSCQKNWWVNLLYINNVYKTEEQCFGWAWYLANDMQFYVIAPVALIPFALGMKKSARSIINVVGACVTVALIITGIVTTGYISSYTNGDILTNGTEYFMNIYQKPWCRVSTFAIGVGLGYILHKSKAKLRISCFLQGVGWLLALLTAMACTFSTYDENAPGRPSWGVEARSAHETLFRPGWGMVLAWVILMCCTGHGGVVNWMLSWDWWQPLARLTYGAYLIHPILMMMAVTLVRSLIHISGPWIVLLFFGYASVSYILAFLLSILVEAPLLQLEKILLGK